MRLAWLNFENVSLDVLKKASEPVLPKPFPSLSRKSFWAGRAAAAFLHKKDNLSLQIHADEESGAITLSDPNWHLSIAHTETVAVVALSRFPVGIDIEKKDRDTSKAIDRLLSEPELAHARRTLFDQAAGVERDVWIWTALEAVGKSIGKGITFKREPIEVEWTSYPFIVSRLDRKTDEFIVKTLTRDDFVVSICGERREVESGLDWEDMRLA